MKCKINHDSGVSEVDKQIRSFVLWALGVLQLQPYRDGHDVYTLDVPEPLRASLDGAERVRFTFDAASEESTRDDRDGAPERITLQSRLFVWLVEQLQKRGPVVHAEPAQQPARVHELTTHLFSLYTIDGGNVHLAGCTLEDRPILRLTFGHAARGENQWNQLVHVLIQDDGEPLCEQTLAALHLDQLAAWKGKPPEIDPAVLDRWLRAGQDVVARQHGLAADDLVAAALIWCKYAEGKLAFTIGPRTVELPFADWARMLAEGLARPAPFTCPASGISSYHMAATDDGRITAADAIAICEESGRRVIQTDLETCAATGRRALAEFMVTCPVSQSRVLQSCLAECRMCRQNVSPKAIQSGRCAACRSLRPAGKADLRLARVLGEHPELGHWRRWRIAETDSVYILVAAGILQRLLVVVDKQTLQTRLVAKGHRFTANWTEMPGEKAGMSDE